MHIYFFILFRDQCKMMLTYLINLLTFHVVMFTPKFWDF